MTYESKHKTQISVHPNELFWRMLAAATKQGQASAQIANEFAHITIDPGETTGFAYKLPSTEEFVLDQIKTPDLFEGTDELEKAILSVSRWPTIVTVEDYKVYSWKADAHKFAGLHTPQLIGAIKRIVHKSPHLIWNQRMAQQAKAFVTDDNLKTWGIYEAGMKHARDAERHLVTTLFFHKP